LKLRDVAKVVAEFPQRFLLLPLAAQPLLDDLFDLTDLALPKQALQLRQKIVIFIIPNTRTLMNQVHNLTEILLGMRIIQNPMNALRRQR
jgi:hypothetical protein